MMDVDSRGRATILAALRLYQSALELGDASLFPLGILSIASDEGEFLPLSVLEIDDLCETINTSETTDEAL